MNLLTLLLQTTDTLVTPPVLTPTVETAGDLNLWELACKGGIIMIPLLLLSLLSIYIFFERLQVIRRAAREDNTFMERIKDYIHESDIDSALKLCKKTNTPYSRLIAKGISRLGRPMNDVLVAIENVGNIEIAKLEKGQVLEGTVKNITSYGVFIDLGGVDGLIHITDLSWGRVSHPEEVVSLDQKLNVVILDFDDEKKRIALGLKQLQPHPWDALDPDLKVGDKVKGKVVVMADYGAFIEIAPGVEGLIHVSEMSWSQHLRSAQDFMKVGDEVEAVILTLDREERKMSLGIKQLKPDPWEDIETKYAVGSRHHAKVRNFTNFGVFVEIEEGVDGLIHISDLSWTKKIKHPSEFTQIGADIEVQVLEIDKENRRLSLGHKQLEENPWDVFEGIFTVDSIHEGTIIEMLDKGAVIALPYGVEGFATPKHLVKQDGTQAQLEEKLPFKVIEFNKDAKRIILSHSRIFEDEAKAEAKKENAAKKAAKKAAKADDAIVTPQMEKTTLGDIDALAALKEKLDAEKK